MYTLDNPLMLRLSRASFHNSEKRSSIIFLTCMGDELSFDFMHGRLHEIPTLPECTLSLNLRQNLIKSTNRLQHLSNLKYLDLYDNQISIVENIKDLESLRFLDLSFNLLTELPKVPLGLEELYLVSNRICKVELPLLKNLKILELGDNRLSECPTGLELLSSLESLWLAKNLLKSMEIPILPNLRVLSIQNNRISSLKDMPSLERLEELYLSNNHMESLDIPFLPNLRLLDVSHNRLKDVSHLSSFPNLQELWANDNKLCSIDRLPDLPLSCIYINNNDLPLPYIHKLVYRYPTLKELDGRPLERIL